MLVTNWTNSQSAASDATQVCVLFFYQCFGFFIEGNGIYLSDKFIFGENFLSSFFAFAKKKSEYELHL